MIKEVKDICWIKLNEKYMLIISDSWKGTPLIACPVDILVISKKTKNKYKDCILPIALKNCKVLYSDSKKIKQRSKCGKD